MHLCKLKCAISVNDHAFNSLDCFYLRIMFYHECVSYIVYFCNAQADAAYPQIHVKCLPQ